MNVEPRVGPRRPRNRKATILETAIELFSRGGFAAVGIDDIGQAVGITGPAVYRHFPGKEALLIAALEHSLGRMAAALPATEGSTTELIRSGVAATLNDSGALAVYLREFRRINALGKDAASIRAAQRQIERFWEDVLENVRPDLSEDVKRIRRLAVLGSISAVVFGDATLGRPALDRLLAESTQRIFAAPEVPPGSVERRGGWRPTERKREEILRVALELFRLHGFSGIGVADIADAAGLSTASLYHHYRGKADVLLDAYDRVGERIAVGVEEALAAATSPVDALERLAASFARIAIENVALIVVTGRDAGALPDDERPRLRRRSKTVRVAWSDVVRAVRPDLTYGEVYFLVSTVFPLMTSAVQAVEGQTEWLGEIGQAGMAHIAADGLISNRS